MFADPTARDRITVSCANFTWVINSVEQREDGTLQVGGTVLVPNASINCVDLREGGGVVENPPLRDRFTFDQSRPVTALTFDRGHGGLIRTSLQACVVPPGALVRFAAGRVEGECWQAGPDLPFRFELARTSGP